MMLHSKFRLPLALAMTGFALVLLCTERAIAEDCEDCPPLSPEIITEGGCEYVLDGEHCAASIVSHSETLGEPGAEELMKTVTCNTCNSSSGVTVTWNKEYSWTVSFCLTVGGGVEWGLPVGPNWSITAETTLCYERTETEMIEVELTCGPEEIRHAKVYRIPVPVTFTDIIQFDLVGEYGLVDGPMVCASEIEFSVPCETSERISESITYQWEVRVEDEECPPAWPEG